MYLLLYLALACVPTPLTCGEGTHEEGDTCLPNISGGDGGDGEADLSFDFPACARAEGDGRIDLDALCVDGLCVGDTYADIVAELGQPDDYSPWVEWEDVGIGFDFEGGGSPPDDDALAEEVWLEDAFDGATAGGLGMGVSFACFIEDFGLPGFGGIAGDDGEPQVQSLGWDDPELLVFDNDALGGDGDGLADTIQFEATTSR